MSFRLGTDTYLGQNTCVKYWHHVPPSESIVHVGNFCSIANDVTFFVDGNHHYTQASTFPFWEVKNLHTGVKNGWGKGAPTVGHDVWIGDQCMIMSGVSLGTGAVVCAGSVVTKDVPPYAIVAGNPAVVKKYRFSPEIIDQLLQTAWWDRPTSFIYQTLVPLQGDVLAWIQACKDASTTPCP